MPLRGKAKTAYQREWMRRRTRWIANGHAEAAETEKTG